MRRGITPLLLLAFAAVVGVSWLHAQDSVTLDFPLKTNEGVLPVGLSGWPSQTNEGLATLEIPLLRLNEEGALVVTVIFEDEDGRLIQAKWKGPDGQETLLSNNICEGVRGWNQRALKVPAELLSDAGSLVFQTDGEMLPIRRVNLAWTWLSQVFIGTAAQSAEVVPDLGRILTKQDFEDRSSATVPDTWSKGIWKAMLQETKENLDEPLEFSFAVDGAPRAGILRVRLLGLPLDGTADVWINGHKIEAVSLEVPELSSEGYFQTPDGRLGYAGWRTASANVPLEYFQAGENSIVFGARAGAYIKDAYLELNFEAEGAPFAVEGSTSPVSSPSEQTPAAVPAETLPDVNMPIYQPGPTIVSVPESL